MYVNHVRRALLLVMWRTGEKTTVTQEPGMWVLSEP